MPRKLTAIFVLTGACAVDRARPQRLRQLRASAGNESGTLRATYASFPDYLDPALSYDAEGWTAM